MGSTSPAAASLKRTPTRTPGPPVRRATRRSSMASCTRSTRCPPRSPPRTPSPPSPRRRRRRTSARRLPARRQPLRQRLCLWARCARRAGVDTLEPAGGAQCCRPAGRPSARRASGPAPPARSASGGTPAPRTLGAFMRPVADPGMSPSNPTRVLHGFRNPLAPSPVGCRPSLGSLTVEGRAGEPRLCGLEQPQAGWRAIEAVVDSGAEETVAPPGLLPGQIEESPMQRAGGATVPRTARACPTWASRSRPSARRRASIAPCGSKSQEWKGLSSRWRSSRRPATVSSSEPTRGTSSTFQVGDGSGSSARVGSTCCACR